MTLPRRDLWESDAGSTPETGALLDITHKLKQSNTVHTFLHFFHFSKNNSPDMLQGEKNDNMRIIRRMGCSQ